jgi:osmotically-inducible protein OsmY
MRRLACALVLVFTGIGLGQQQRADTPPMLVGRAAASEPSGELTTPEAQQLIQDGLSSDRELAQSNVSARTDDRAIVLIGSVGNEKQHEVALRIAQSFTGGRQIVDKIKVGKWTRWLGLF